jgi:quercetin dioxygenase-like cupin family protein
MSELRVAAALGLSLFAATVAGAEQPACSKATVDLARAGDSIEVLHVTTGPDNKSHAARIRMPAVFTSYLGLQLAHFDFGDPANVVIVRGPPDLDIPLHPAPYREIFIVLSGGSTALLSDGTRHELGPGAVVLFEDVTGPGHGATIGPCGYVALDLQFKPAPPVPAAPAAAAATAAPTAVAAPGVAAAKAESR